MSYPLARATPLKQTGVKQRLCYILPSEGRVLTEAQSRGEGNGVKDALVTSHGLFIQ